MTTGATPGSYDLPTGYEGYLFSTGTITRAVIWKNSGSTDIKIACNDYVRIARSTAITTTERGDVGTDWDGIGWARCYDGLNCEEEDGSGDNPWPVTWDDVDDTANDKYQLDDAVLTEPIMIWSDNDTISITW